MNSSATTHGVLAPFTSELDKIAPSFQINGSQIEILKTPADFYETLKVWFLIRTISTFHIKAANYGMTQTKIRTAKRRIFLSTLYIGKSERELVRPSALLPRAIDPSARCLTVMQIDTIHAALRDNPKLQVSILTDALRGTREAPEPSCASLLAPLVDEFGSERVDIRMYHTPNLTGLRKKHIPKRINEGWGLQHMKLYGIDVEIILSGYVCAHSFWMLLQQRLTVS